MIFRLLLLATLWQAASPFSQLRSFVSKELQRQVGGISLAVITALPFALPAQAVEVLKIDADVPALVQLAKDNFNKDIALKLAKQTADAVKVTQFPSGVSDLKEFVRDVAAGDVFIELNGMPVDVSVLSDKGAIDVGVVTELGDISFTVTSPYLPKLPFLPKRVVTISSDDATSVLPLRAGAVEATEAAVVPKKPLLDQAFFLDPLNKGWTNLQVLGSASLGLGAAYAGAYGFYVKSGQDEERKSREKKEAFAAKRKAAAKEVAAKEKA